MSHAIILMLHNIFEIAKYIAFLCFLDMIPRNQAVHVTRCFICILMIQDKFAGVFNRYYSPLAVRRIYPHASVVNAETYGVAPAEIYQRR